MSYNTNFNQHPGKTPNEDDKRVSSAKVLAVVSILVFIPFIVVGINLIVRGISEASNGSAIGQAHLIFGCIWLLSIVAGIFSVIGRIRFFMSETSVHKRDHNDHEDHEEENSYSLFGFNRNNHRGCKADHSDDDDNSLKGYE